MAAKGTRSNELACCTNPACQGVRLSMVMARSAGPGILRRTKRCPACGAVRRTIEQDEPIERQSVSSAPPATPTPPTPAEQLA